VAEGVLWYAVHTRPRPGGLGPARLPPYLVASVGSGVSVFAGRVGWAATLRADPPSRSGRAFGAVVSVADGRKQLSLSDQLGAKAAAPMALLPPARWRGID